MPLPALLLPIIAAAAQAPAPPEHPILVTGHAGPPFISPMGEPFRAKSPTEDTLATWFNQADRNRDGVLTLDEMSADADRFFATLDTDHDGEIDPDELAAYEWQMAPEIQVNSKLKRPRAAAVAAAQPDGRGLGGGGRRLGSFENVDGAYDGTNAGLEGGARYALLNLPEPVAGADADLNRSITQAEFRQAAAERFALLDKSHSGRLTLAELEGMRPAFPAPGNKSKRRDDKTDARIGIPLPSTP